MPTVQLALLKALVDLFKGVTFASVSFGEPVALQSGDFLAVGISDPEAGGRSSAASSSIDWSTSMTPDGYAESGEIMCAAISVSGSDDLELAAESAYAILSAAVGAIRDNYTATQGTNLLGVEGLWELHLSSVELPVLVPGEFGATAYLLFRLAFQALT